MAINFFPLLDIMMAELFKTLEPFYSVPGLDKPYSVSKLLSLDTPNNNILANYIADVNALPGDDSLLEEL